MLIYLISPLLKKEIQEVPMESLCCIYITKLVFVSYISMLNVFLHIYSKRYLLALF
ncbi:hypothetical protein HanXRQr2_Chr05g0199721 [Helianthus annuus]|uniref:Uncharacterized protein n=1 Tax=Helianthus annuus TaxID=4232 RepID=A0A9K3IX56_HELAN|nr:hypothetical protein HanXRQr2_Chr05g0199721 [Helianthus annuus]KAJ0921520.1 hypothetical protein HanPSC8_Chr05g0192521 [Helianthus annuus]